MQSITDSILQAIQQNAEWAWVIVFVIAFLESMAIIGLFIPGWVLLVGVGTMIGAGVLDFPPIVVSAYLGAVIGEYLSFYLGFHYHQQITQWPIVAKRKHLLKQSQDLFEKYGAYGVFIGRFIGPARAVIPLIAGISQMPKKIFVWVNLTSGLLWAPLYLIPGLFVGAAVELNRQESLEFLFVVFVLLLIGWAVVGQIKRTIQVLLKKSDRNLYFALLNSCLILTVFIVSLIVVLQSSYYDFLLNIMLVVGQRLV